MNFFKRSISVFLRDALILTTSNLTVTVSVTVTVECKHTKYRVYLRSACVWVVNSTMSQHVDYLVFIDTSERSAAL